MDEVVVIGAGILGVATAFELARRGGGRVRVLEARVPGAGATGHAGALVRADYENETEARLALYSLNVYRNFADAVGGGNAGFLQHGLLVAVPGEGVAAAKALAERQRRWGVDIHVLAHAAARDLAPGIHSGDVGLFLHQADAGACDPMTALSGYIASAKRCGVLFEWPCQVQSIITRAGRVQAVQTDRGLRQAGAVVIAAGTHAAELLPQGLDFGLVPRLSRVAVFRPIERDAARPGPTVIDRVQSAWFSPMPGGAILVGCEAGGITGVAPDADMEAGGAPPLALYRATLARRFEVSSHAPLRGVWGGTYTLSPDHRPLVGAVPGIEGLYLAGGDSGGAFKIAPALAAGLAETIMRGSAATTMTADLAPARVLNAQRCAAPATSLTVSR